MDFVEDEDAPEQARPRNTRQQPRKRGSFPRQGCRRLTADIPEQLHKRLKLQALQEDCTVTDIVIEASCAWLANRRKG